MRYLLIILLNLPVILNALLTTVTSFKTKKISGAHARHQLLKILIVSLVLIFSYPLYNYCMGRPLFFLDVSLLDILQVTVIIYLFFIIQSLRQKLDKTEKLFRDLQSELSIQMSLSSKEHQTDQPINDRNPNNEGKKL